MARLINGLLSGRLGNMIYYTKNGKQMVRARIHSSKTPGPGRLRTWAGFKTVMDFMKHLTEFVAYAFPVSPDDYAKGRSGFNLAVGANVRSALLYEGEVPVIDYARVLVANGNLKEALGAEVVLEDEGLRFNWLCPTGMDWSYYSDQVMMVVYFPDQQQAEYVIAGAQRTVCSDLLQLSAAQMSQRMEIYISFISDDRKAAATSTYLGRLH